LLICQLLQLGNEALATSMKTSPSDEFNMTWAPFASLQSGLEELASLYEPWHWLGVQNVPDKWFGSNMWWQSFFIHYQSLIKHFRLHWDDVGSLVASTCHPLPVTYKILQVLVWWCCIQMLVHLWHQLVILVMMWPFTMSDVAYMDSLAIPRLHLDN
jgi:hypothetical protein